MTDVNSSKSSPYRTRFEYRNGLLYIAKKNPRGSSDITILTSDEVMEMLEIMLIGKKSEAA